MGWLSGLAEVQPIRNPKKMADIHFVNRSEGRAEEFFFFNSKSQGYVSTDEADADTVTSNLLLMGRLNPTLSHAHLLSQHITR